MNLNDLAKMMRDYSDRHKIHYGITLQFEDDLSGGIKDFIRDVWLFTFEGEEDLIKKLSK